MGATVLAAGGDRHTCTSRPTAAATKRPSGDQAAAATGALNEKWASRARAGRLMIRALPSTSTDSRVRPAGSTASVRTCRGGGATGSGRSGWGRGARLRGERRRGGVRPPTARTTRPCLLPLRPTHCLPCLLQVLKGQHTRGGGHQVDGRHAVAHGGQQGVARQSQGAPSVWGAQQVVEPQVHGGGRGRGGGNARRLACGTAESGPRGCSRGTPTRRTS